jgi:hypothetical protein
MEVQLMRYHQEEYQIPAELKEHLKAKNMLGEEEIFFPFVKRQLTALSKLFAFITQVVKNRSNEKYISVANDTIFVFYTKGMFKPKAVDERNVQKILIADVSNISKKEAYLENYRVQKFVITHKGGTVKGFVTFMKARQMLKQIEEKLNK